MRKHWYIGLLLGLVTLIYSFPVLRNPARNIVDGYDGVFATWAMNWSAWSSLFKPSEFYNAPIFYPYTLTTTFSDPMLTSGLLAVPLLLITKEPLIANTTSVVLGFFLLALGTYLFVEKVTRQRSVALAASLLATFGSVHLRYLGHLHTFFIPAIPWGLYLWLRYIDTKHIRYMIAWGALFLFQVYNSPLSGVFYLFSFLPFVFHMSSIQTIKKNIRPIGITIGLVIFLALIFYFPYFQAANQYQSARTIRDAAHFALSADELTNSSRGLSYIGFGLFVYISYAVHQAFTHRRKVPVLAIRTFATGCLALIMSLGPVLKWAGNTVKIPLPIPLPYAIAYVLIPGFQAFRDPSRWVLLSFFLLCISTALLIPKKKGGLFLLLAAVTLLTEQGWSYPVVTLPSWNERPPVYLWLQTQKASFVLFLPPHLYSFPETAVEETRRMLWTLPWDHNQVLHMYNGYSGFAPQERIDGIVRFAITFPSPETITALQTLSPDIIVINRDFQRADRDQQIKSLGYTKTYQDENVDGYTKQPLTVE